METLVVEVNDRVAYVRLRRPRAMNAISEQMLDELASVVESCASDRDLRAVVIRGDGAAFCVGLDLGVLKQGFADLAYLKSVLDRVNGLLFELERLDLPVVAAVNGTTRAGGFELLLSCDLVVAADEARIGDHHIQFGVAPGGGGSQRAQRKLSPQHAAELLLTGRWLSGAEAVDYGLALRSVPLAELDESVERLVDQFRGLSRDALGTVKGMIRDGGQLPLQDGVRLETERLVQYLQTSPDGTEGLRASLEGRPPAWAEGRRTD